MLLGSPPDMVHGAPPYRARPPAYPMARISALLFIIRLYYYKLFRIKRQVVFIENTVPAFCTHVLRNDFLRGFVIIVPQNHSVKQIHFENFLNDIDSTEKSDMIHLDKFLNEEKW